MEHPNFNGENVWVTTCLRAHKKIKFNRTPKHEADDKFILRRFEENKY